MGSAEALEKIVQNGVTSATQQEESLSGRNELQVGGGRRSTDGKVVWGNSCLTSVGLGNESEEPSSVILDQATLGGA